MASIVGLESARDIGGALKHDLRIDYSSSPNEDIDPDRTELNYSMLDRSYENTKVFVSDRLHSTYCHGSGHPAFEVVIQAPEELPEEDEGRFFEVCHGFMNELCGEENCIAATIHKDEAGLAHMHSVYFKPSVENPKYISAEDKQNKGFAAISERFGCEIDDECRDKLSADINAYEHGHMKDKTIYKEFAAEFGITRDEARWAVRQVRRSESEMLEERFDASFLDRDFYLEFHDKLQEVIDEAGLECNVHKGNTEGRGWTVLEKKAEDRYAEYEAQIEDLNEQIAEKDAEIDRLSSMVKDIGSRTHMANKEWGSLDGWGDLEYQEEKDINR